MKKRTFQLLLAQKDSSIVPTFHIIDLERGVPEFFSGLSCNLSMFLCVKVKDIVLTW